MNPVCAEAESQHCFNYGCFPSPFLVSMVESHDTSSKPRPSNVTASNHDFVAATYSTLHPFTHFTNHESLPSLQGSYDNFIKAFPQFSKTSKIDEVRAQEYHHLNHSNTCFDYNGCGLFSYDQQQRFCPKTSISSSSSSSSSLFFDVSYKSVNLHSQILYGGHESELELRMRERIMRFMNVSEADYTLVFIANEVSAFKLVANSFQFQSSGELLTVYDHHSEAIDMMVESCKKEGVNTLSAEFSFPNLGIDWRRLKKIIVNRREKKKKGLFVFPVRSRVTGTPYSYVWMSMAQEKGWHVLLDACSLRPKEMSSLGMSMFKPDFMVCSFYKVFGENPSGFGCLFVKKTSISALKDSGSATSMGIVSLVPAVRTQLPQESLFIADEEIEPKAVIETSQCETEDERSDKVESSSEIVESITHFDSSNAGDKLGTVAENLEIECRGLDHADSVGLMLINCRAKCLINWLVNALMSLRHPCPENGLSLIRIYGPKICSHRGPSVAFNLFDWNGEKIDPAIVQKLADRNNISLGNTFLQNIKLLDKNEQEGQRALETRANEFDGLGQPKKTHGQESGILVVTAALGFLTNFEDAYRLWAFISRFLDADFVEKETWRYMALNQKTIDV